MIDSRRLTWAAVALVVVHFLFLAVHHEPALSGPDANGYFAQARMLATEGHTYQELASPLQFTGAHWVDAGDGRYFSKYPPGFPLLLAVPFLLFGPAAALWVDPLMVTGALVALFLVARHWLGAGWALVVTVLMATNPLVNQHAVPGFAHTAVAFLLMWGLYGLVRWRQSDTVVWLALSGLCFGAIPTARYAEALYVGAFGLFLLYSLSSTGKAWRRALPGLAAAALPMAGLALRNQLAFGAFWRTGYAVSGEQTGFGIGYFADHWVSYLEGLSGPGVGLLFGLGIAGIVMLAADLQTRDRGLLLVALVVPTTLLYMAYYWGGGQGGLRFLLPTSYLYTLAAVWVLRQLVDSLGRPAVAAAFVLVVMAVVWGSWRSVAEMGQQQERDAALARLTEVVGEHVSDGSILFADRKISQHLDVVGSWRLGMTDALGGMDRRRRPAGMPGRRRVGPLGDGGGYPLDRPNPMAGGARQRLERYRDLASDERATLIRADLAAWAGEEAVIYLLAPRDAITSQLAGLGLRSRWRELATIELPEPGEDGGGGRRGRRRFAGGRPPMAAMGMGRGRGPGFGPGMGSASGPLVLAAVSL